MDETLTPSTAPTRLTEVLRRLETTDRRRAAEHVAEALAADGDARGNAAYPIALWEQAAIQTRNARLEERPAGLRAAEPHGAGDVVDPHGLGGS